MLEIIEAGGWLMLPIILGSILALAIVLERFWTLRRGQVLPPGLLDTTLEQIKKGRMGQDRVRALASGSPLGKIFATTIIHRNRPHDVMRERIEEAGHQVVHELERYLNALGTIASISPLLGLLGTVFGMIQVFSVITNLGVGNPHSLAGGIAQALITTAAGLSVAIPSYVFYRYFRGLVEKMAIEMEDQAVRLVDSLAQLKTVPLNTIKKS